MKIALASAKFINNDIAYNLHQMERYARRAKDSGADLICFGETFLQGFDSLCWNYERQRSCCGTFLPSYPENLPT